MFTYTLIDGMNGFLGNDCSNIMRKIYKNRRGFVRSTHSLPLHPRLQRHRRPKKVESQAVEPLVRMGQGGRSELEMMWAAILYPDRSFISEHFHIHRMMATESLT